MSEKNGMKIIRLESENIKRLQAVSIEANGKTVIIGGENEQGKTSTLDSIAYALGGKSLIPPTPIRKGQKHARVEIDLGDLIVERRFTKSGSTLEVRPKDGGQKYASPQSVLDKLVGDLSFDPLAFVAMKPAEQLKALKEIVGVSFDDLEAESKQLYDDRALINQDAKNLEGQLAGLQEHKDAPAKSVSVDEIIAQIDDADKQNQSAVEFEMKIELANRQAEQNAEAAERCETEIEDLRQRAVVLKMKKKEFIEAQNTALALVADLLEQRNGTMPIDTAPLKEAIRNAEDVNRKVRENEQRKSVASEMRAKNAASMKLTLAIEDIVAKKEQRLAEAKFPVEGLAFSDDGVLLNSLPFEQASEEQQIMVSAAMGLALRPELRVLLIRKAALLDDKHLTALANWGVEHDCQLWIERVGQGKECTVIIENGLVAEGVSNA